MINIKQLEKIQKSLKSRIFFTDRTINKLSSFQQEIAKISIQQQIDSYNNELIQYAITNTQSKQFIRKHSIKSVIKSDAMKQMYQQILTDREQKFTIEDLPRLLSTLQIKQEKQEDQFKDGYEEGD